MHGVTGPIISEKDPPFLDQGVTYLEEKLCSYNVGRKKKYVFFLFNLNGRIIALSSSTGNVSLLNFICKISMCTILYMYLLHYHLDANCTRGSWTSSC